jgi:hypothetical protein
MQHRNFLEIRERKMEYFSSNQRRFFLPVFCFLLLFSSCIGLLPVAVRAADPNLHGIKVGTVDRNKEIQPKNGVTSINIQGIPGDLGATISNIEVDGVQNGQRVLGFADLDAKADKGWYFVDRNEAIYWINQFDGNQNFILTGQTNVYSNTVSSLQDGFTPYQAYNLAELATASGGAGFTIRDNLEPDGSGGYTSIGHFRTPQPTGSVSTNKTKYQVNEQVTISANATDYSYYDRGILVWNLSVINKTTGRGYYQFEASKEVEDTSGYIPPVNETSNPKPFPWNQSHQYKPTEPGVYEVSLTVTDRHHRSRQGSSSMSVSAPYTYQFTVGDVSPEPDPDPEQPPGSCKRTAMDLRLEQENSDRELSGVASHGEEITVKKDTRIVITAKKAGTFTHNGVSMEAGSGGNRKVGITEAPLSGSFTIRYESDDGTECWEKTFRVNDGEDGVDQCPIITVNGGALRSGSTIEVAPGEEVRFQAKYTDAYGEVAPAEIKWDVIRPDGSVETLPGGYNEEGGRERWHTYNSAKLSLPFGNGKDPHDVLLEKGKTYKVQLNFESAKWDDRPECDWFITIEVRDTTCTIAEQKKIKFKKYGEPPSPFPPGGEELSSFDYDAIYKEHFTKTDNGYDTHMKLSADVEGTWYLDRNGSKIPLSQKLQANEKLDLILPDDIEAGEEIKLVFLSKTGCIREFSFIVLTYNKCYELMIKMENNMGDQKWVRDVERGETITLEPSDFPSKGYYLNLFTGEDTKYNMQWFDPATGDWKYSRDGSSLSGGTNPTEDHKLRFPRDDDTDVVLEGLYLITFYDDTAGSNLCDGHFFVQIGDGTETPDGENLLIIKNSFTIAPKMPQAAGTPSTITFQVKNAGSLEHDTKLAVRWESSAKETVLDVDNFKPGEVRKITVPTQYPPQSEDFIANINPSKNKPSDETIWSDNRAQWPVKVTASVDPPTPPGGGENYDGGEIGLEIYDSRSRKLQKLQVNADGVWEGEPANIRVVIDQTKINEGFQKTQQAINQKINQYKAQLEQSVSGEEIKNVQVTAQPGWISDAKSMAVYNPTMLDLKVSGPGTPQQWQVRSSSTGGDHLYTGTLVPTQTTWRQGLQAQKYKAEINGFVITMDYSIQFDLTYESCTTDDEDQETCEAKNVTETMTGRYAITVKGGEHLFEVFEPNAAASIRHTPEWAEYHGRDRYPNSLPNDFYAGERILTQVELQTRHRHPVSGLYPDVVSAQAWIHETGKRQTILQSLLSLQSMSPQRWIGSTYSASKLGTREVGVDTPLMGDKQRGFQKDSSYAVYYSVQFQFAVKKGFPYANKTAGQGHELTDYRIPFRIIANAWERQGIRNHTTQ